MTKEINRYYQNTSNRGRIRRVHFMPYLTDVKDGQSEERDEQFIGVDTEPMIQIDSILLSEQPTLIMPAIKDLIRTQKIEVPSVESESYVSIIRKLVKSSGLYALSSLASPLVTLLLSPFLTRNLSRNEYGALAILLAFISLLAGITQLGLPTAVVRAYTYEYESKRDRLDVLSTLFILLFFVSLSTAILVAAAAPWFAGVLLNDPSLETAIRVCAVVILLQNFTIPGLCWLRAEGRAAYYSTISLLNILVSAIATILFVGVLHMNVDGAILATGVGYTVIIISTLPIILRSSGFYFRLNIAKGMLSFGFPHVLNFVSGWILQLLDRYLLGLWGSLAQVASYAVAYNIGGALSAIVISPFSLAWWVIMYSVAKRNDAHFIFRMIFRWFAFVLLFTAFSLAIFGIMLLDLFFPLSYHSAASVIPIVVLSMVFNGINTLLTLGVSLKRKIWLTTISLGSSAILNALLNFFLIPSYGAMGAALATLIAYISLAIISGIINQQLYPVPLEIGLFVIALSIGIVFYQSSNFLVQNQQVYSALGIHVISIFMYGGSLIMLGLLYDKVRKRMEKPLHETFVNFY